MPRPLPKPLPSSPIALHTARAQNAARDAAIWLGMASAIWLAWKLAPVLMLIVGGLVFAAGLQGAERLLGRVWKAPHALRMSFVIIIFLALMAGFLVFASVQLAAQVAQLQATLNAQFGRIVALAHAHDVDLGTAATNPLGAIQAQLSQSLGSVRDMVGSVVGAIGGLVFMLMIGIYVALDPRIYERGIEWFTPEAQRPIVATTVKAMARTLRMWVGGRMLAMAIEGFIIFIGLSLAGVPLAGLLGLTAGLLTFVPTLGALVAGIIIMAVGFSVSTDAGLWAMAIFATVQFIEGNILTPLIEKKVVDLAPAVVLAAQLLFGVLFGIIGVALADPIVAMAKVALSQRSTAPEGETPDTKTAAG